MKMKKNRKPKAARHWVSVDAKRRLAGAMRHRANRRALEKSKKWELE